MPTITIIALALFAATYIVMIVSQKLRPYAAVTSAVVFIVLGLVSMLKPGLFVVNGADFSYTALQALKEIDWNVIMMIAGTMGTVDDQRPEAEGRRTGQGKNHDLPPDPR